MARKRKPSAPRAAKRPPPGPPARSPRNVTLRRIRDDAGWELVHPRCALECREDIEDVVKMIEAGEIEVARDELRWLLGGCSDFIEAHRLLGELALMENDVPLARGHFGYAFRIGQKAIAAHQPNGPVPYHRPANRALFEAGRGLVQCLTRLGKPELAAEVVAELLRWDPSDPLDLGDTKKGRDAPLGESSRPG